MTNRQDITNISVSFQGIAKGKRKAAHHIVSIEQVNGHILLNADQIATYTTKAWAVIDKNYKMTSITASILVNHGHNEDEMSFIELMSKQRLPITKANL
jgi:ribosomal protein S9